MKENGLTGSLKDFGLTDLFQLLGQQQKTGILHLQEGKKEVQIVFDKGMVAGAAPVSESAENHPLGRRLVRGGLLSNERWGKICKLHKDELLTLERAVQKSGWVRTEDLMAVLRLLTFETLYEMFKWQKGGFYFETKAVSENSGLMEPLNAEFLLLDVLRMVDEWPLLAKRIPSLEMVLQKVNPMATTLDLAEGTPLAKERTFQMDSIYNLINGQRTIREIMDRAFIGEFETCKNIVAMMDAGIVEPLDVTFRADRKKKIHVSTYLRTGGAYVLIFILLAWGAYRLADRFEEFPFSSEERRGWSTLQGFLQKVELEKARNVRGGLLLEEDLPSSPPQQ